MEFEWDQAKAAANLAKHGVSFEEAKTVFDDRLYVDFYDPKHSVNESHIRRQRLGSVNSTIWQGNSKYDASHKPRDAFPLCARAGDTNVRVVVLKWENSRARYFRAKDWGCRLTFVIAIRPGGRVHA